MVDGVLGFRASAWVRRDGGWIDRVDPTTLSPVDKNANHDDTVVLRLAATWAPISSIGVTPSIVYQDRERNNLSIYWPSLSDPARDTYVSANPTGRTEPDRYYLPALKITADLGAAQFISNTSYYHRDDVSGYDGTLYNLSYYQTLGWPPTFDENGNQTGGSVPYAGSSPCAGQAASCYPLLDGSGVHLPAALRNYRSPTSVTNKQSNFTQEFRLQSNDPSSRLIWTVGAFFSLNRSYSLEEIHDPMADQFFQYVYGVNIADVFGTATNPDGSSYLPMGDAYFNQLIGHDRQLAGFGEIVWSITDRLKFTGGLRYSKTDFTFSSYNDGPQNSGPSVGSGEQHEKPITERVSLSFQQDPGNLYYATYSTGFRIGGANAPIPFDVCSQDFNNFGIPGSPDSYKSDTVRSYEIGAKNNFDDRVKLASSLYYIKWSNIQQTISLPTCALNFTTNLGTAVSRGFDLQADFAITDDLTLESAIGYTDAHYTDNAYPGPASTMPLAAKGDAVIGESLTPAAPWTVTVGAQYNFNAFGGRNSFVRIDYELQTKSNRLTALEDPATVQYATCTAASGAVQACNYTPSATTFVSFRAGTNLGGWNVSAFIDNLLDSHTITNFNYSAVDGFGPQPAATPLYRDFTFRPRTFGLTFTYRQ
jgi:outer membrane receptor protein involved in Fe transport